MASSKQASVDFISKGLEAEVNKRAAISIFDRFGGKNPLFTKQFEDTKISVNKYKTSKQKNQIETSLKFVEQTLENKTKELSLLSSFNKKKISKIEKICETVSELKDEFEFEMQTLHPEEEEPEHGQPELETITNTIMEWRTENLPNIPR
ncbi:tegument protein UL14 [Vespertilionid gammaherpesvirus 1]|uniref:Tegument protein UL14 n=1 Tax=Vespertilionid gammaherpesvirus 1 TaxID=2560830 RepID=A0A109QFM2_9GAMA|nr:tegument protein UL14 [Myotis gammaherpesvirus 8]AMA67391.1 tegument protein UL14 [Vespertilionid gammaherpesvirus 1]